MQCTFVHVFLLKKSGNPGDAILPILLQATQREEQAGQRVRGPRAEQAHPDGRLPHGAGHRAGVQAQLSNLLLPRLMGVIWDIFQETRIIHSLTCPYHPSSTVLLFVGRTIFFFDLSSIFLFAINL